MNSKYALIVLIFALLFGVASAMPVMAKSGSSNDTEVEQEDVEDEDEDEDEEDDDDDKEEKALTDLRRKSPAKVLIHEGKVELNAATVTSVNASSTDAVVSLFGLSFKVNTDNARFKEGTELSPDAVVWIKGKIDASTGIVNATEIRTFTANSSDSSGNKTKLEELQKQVEQLMERLKKLLGT